MIAFGDELVRDILSHVLGYFRGLQRSHGILLLLNTLLFGMIEAIVNGLMDEVRWFRNNRVKFLAGICVIQFLAALPMVTGSGMYWVTLIDWYSSGLPLMIAAALEITCISWNYGVGRFIYDIQCMIGHRPFLWQWWQFVWSIVTPCCIMLLVVGHFVFYSAVKYGGRVYPSWAEALGWLSAIFSILSIPIVAIYQILTHPRAKGTFLQRVSALLKCDPDWGPNDPNIYYRYRKQNLFKKDQKEERNSRNEELIACCKRTGSGSEASSIEKLDLPPVYGSP